MRSDLISGPRPLRPGQEPPRAAEPRPPQRGSGSHGAPAVPLLRGPPPVRVQFWDGTALGPAGGDTLEVRSRDAVRRLLWSPSELGLARAFVAGDLDFDGDIFEMLALLHAASPARIRSTSRLPWQALRAAYRLGALGRPIPPPPEEAAPRGRLHSRTRDAQAVRHHYDVSNDFYAMVLGPSMTYSCARFSSDAVTLEAAQESKHDLICRKLGLPDRTGQRILDVGCGWGSLAIHAARHYGAQGGRRHAQPGASAVRRANGSRPLGFERQVEIRLQDYRDVRDGTFDGIASVGMFEHVGSSKSAEYFGSHAPAAQTRGQAAQPRHLERGRIEHRLEILHRAVRLPRWRAHRRGSGRAGDGASGLRGARRRVPPRALRQDAPGLGGQPRSSTGRPPSLRSGCVEPASGSSTWRRRPTGSRTVGSRSTRCSASSPHRTGGAACRLHGAAGPELVRQPPGHINPGVSRPGRPRHAEAVRRTPSGRRIRNRDDPVSRVIVFVSLIDQPGDRSSPMSSCSRFVTLRTPWRRPAMPRRD